MQHDLITNLASLEKILHKITEITNASTNIHFIHSNTHSFSSCFLNLSYMQAHITAQRFTHTYPSTLSSIKHSTIHHDEWRQSVETTSMMQQFVWKCKETKWQWNRSRWCEYVSKKTIEWINQCWKRYWNIKYDGVWKVKKLRQLWDLNSRGLPQ